MELPFERLVAVGEHAHLSRDQLVEFGSLETTEVAIRDAPTVRPADETEQWSVALDADTVRKGVRNPCAQLLVVAGEEVGRVEVAHAGDPDP